MKHIITIISFLLLAGSGFAQNKEAIQETIAMIKTNLGESQQKIKQYEWIETTTVFVDGEQKSSTQKQCYYGVDGKLYKVAAGAAEQKTPGGLRGKIAKNKKEDIQDYIEQCVTKIQTYLPPDPAKLQQIYTSGKTSINVLEPGKKYKLGFPDYQQAGDMLSIAADNENKLLNGIEVNTYVDKPGEKVNFSLSYDTLPDQTQFAAKTVLEAQAKKVKIVIENSGYKKAN